MRGEDLAKRQLKNTKSATVYPKIVQHMTSLHKIQQLGKDQTCNSRIVQSNEVARDLYIHNLFQTSHSIVQCGTRVGKRFP